MHILFSNDVRVPIELNNSILQNTILGIYKNLQHVDIPFREWDNPTYLSTLSYDQLIDQLIEFADRVSIKIDRQQCLNNDQSYFNYIHKLYEQGYNGNPAWLNFHEHIHLCEGYHQAPRLVIHYREKAGLLQKKFNIDWLSGSTTNIKAGDVFLEWAELGKIPYRYWIDQEPNNINRICELAKPWINLIPKLQVALEDKDTLSNKKIAEFEKWWSTYDESWRRHWQLPKWTITDQFSVIVIGRIDPIETLTDLLKNQIHPIKVQL